MINLPDFTKKIVWSKVIFSQFNQGDYYSYQAGWSKRLFI